MRRRLFTILSGLSLLACVATAALWVRSYWVGDVVTWTHLLYEEPIDSIPQGQIAADYFRVISVGTVRGGIGANWWLMSQDAGDWPTLEYRASPAADFDTSPRAALCRFAFSMTPASTPPASSARWSPDVRVSFPSWLVVLGTALLPASRWLWRPRRPSGLCSTCGYDLRATPDRCPECGMMISGHGG